MAGSTESVAATPRVAQFKGPGTLPPIPEANYSSYILQQIRTYKHKVALIDAESGAQYTYDDLCRLIPRAAGGLKSSGVKPGDVVLLITKNHVDYPLVMLSIIHLGATCVPVSPTLQRDELVHVAKVSEARHVIAHASVAASAKAAYSRLPRATLKKLWILGRRQGNNRWEELLRHDPVPAFDVTDGLVPSKSVALMLFSSGTTGLPKGVMLSHRTLLVPHIRQQYQESIRPPNARSAESIYKSVMLLVPVSHVYGHAMVATSLFVGGSIVMLPKFTPKNYFETIEKFKVTLSPIVPYIANFLIDTPLMKKYDTSSLQAFTTAAAPISSNAVLSLMKKSGRAVGGVYGLTETYGTISANSGTLGFNPESVGRVAPYIQVKVVDVETGEMLGERKEGEICAKGPSIMLGYVNNPEATAATLDEEGWLHTGDIGYFDENDFLFITDRIKDLIKVKALQVSPTELESVLLSHEDVSDAAVLGVPHPKLGEAPRAYIVPRKGVTLKPKEVEEFIAARVSSHKQLAGGVQIVDEIPRNPAGKILRRQLKREFMKSKL